MNNFLNKSEFVEKDILEFIENEIEESIHLDFKSAGSLGKSENKKKELSKDIASFANSDGGIIVYGIKEINHKADSVSFIDGNEFIKEWIEQVINSTIQRHIPDLKIYPIRFDSSLEKTVYVIEIPKSTEAPHISRDKRFYKRFNFESVMMEEYEIRELYGRRSKSMLVIDGYGISQPDTDEDIIKLRLEASIYNAGDIPESSYKLNLYFDNFDLNSRITWDKTDGDYTYTRYKNKRVKISTSKSQTIYPTEKIDVLRINIEINKKNIEETIENLQFELKLFYENGEDSLEGDLKEAANKIQY